MSKNTQGRTRILSAFYDGPIAADADVILAAVTDTGDEQVIEAADLDSQPDVARTVTATAGGTAADIKAVSVIVAGTNTWGESITETLPAFTVNTAGIVQGTKAFASITSVTLPAHDGTAATTAIGAGAKLGLPDLLTRNTVIASYLAGAKEASAPTVAFDADEVEKNLVTPVGSLDGSKSFIVDYYTGGI